MSNTEEEIMFLSHLYPQLYTTIPPPPPQPQGGEGKRRRRRKKAKAEGGELAKKRKLTQQQIDVLELNFKDEHKLESGKKERLAMDLGLEPRQVAVWFQNRRARYKSQKLEDEYLQLKAQHDTVLAQKCQLQSQILELKQQLSDAEKVSSSLIAENNSPSSSFSVETLHDTNPLFMGNYPMMGGLDNNAVFYAAEENNEYGYNGWVNLFDD